MSNPTAGANVFGRQRTTAANSNQVED